MRETITAYVQTAREWAQSVSIGNDAIVLGLALFVLLSPIIPLLTFGAVTVVEPVNAEVETSTFDSSTSIASGPSGISFNDDGTKMFVSKSETDVISQFSLSTPYDSSTATLSKEKDVSTQAGGIQDVTFNSDGTKMFVVDASNNDIDEYTLTTPFDVGSASYSHSFDLSATLTTDNPQEMAFSDDGKTMFVLDGGSLFKFSLSTAFDVSTASYANTKVSFASEEQYATGFTFANNGQKLLVTGNDNDSVFEYELTNSYAISGASYTGNFLDVSSKTNVPSGLDVAKDGEKLYVTEITNDAVLEYNSTFAISAQTSEKLTFDVRNYMNYNQTYPYAVYAYNNTTDTTTDVTQNATLTIENVTLNGTQVLTSPSNGTLETINNSAVNATVNLSVEYDTGSEILQQNKTVVVAAPTVENLAILPDTFVRAQAVFGSSTLFALMIAALLSVAASRFVNAFAGLAAAEVVVVIGWFAGFVGLGITLLSVFLAIFLGLNLAENTVQLRGR